MTIKLKGSTDGSVSLQAPADTSPTGTDITLTLPTTAGSANQFVKNSGTAGTLEYSSITEDSSDNIICTARVDATRFRCTDDGTAGTPSINPGLDNDTGLFRPASNTIGFSTAGTERVRITGNGYLLQGATALGTVGSVNGFQASNHIAAASTTNSIFSRRTTNGTVVQFRRDTTAVGNITVTTTSTSYGTSSDHRLKENVVDLDGAITRVKQLAPKRFNFIADADTTVDGFLAHEAQVVVPEAVTGTHNEVDDDGNPVMQGIDQSKLVPLLTAALQEAIAKIETLETKVAELEAGS